MMKKNTAWLPLLILVATVSVFLLANNERFDTVMCWYTLGIIVLSEVFFTVAWTKFGGNPHRFAVIVISAIQTAVNILVSALFLSEFSESYIGYSIYVILSFTILIFISSFFGKAAKNAEKMQGSKEFFLKCRSMVNLAANSTNGEQHREALAKLEENIRFCNDGVLLKDDEKIYSAVCELKTRIDMGADDISDAIKNINDLLSQHDFIAKTSKR